MHSLLIITSIWLSINIGCFVLAFLLFWPRVKRRELPDYLRRAL